MAGCDWDDTTNTCSGRDGLRKHPGPTYHKFNLNANKCKDTLNVCSTDPTSMGFKQHSTVPENYICSKTWNRGDIKINDL